VPVFEPQRKYDWALEIALDDAGDQVIILQSLESAELPKEENEEIELHYASEVRYVAGKVKYETIPLVLKDFVDIGTANAIIKWRRQVQNAETGSTGLARNYKKNADLSIFAPNQSVTRIWKLIGVWPQKVEYGVLDMKENDKVDITVTLRYDRAVPSVGLNSGLSGLNAGVLAPPL
jgi:hypothetical protein